MGGHGLNVRAALFSCRLDRSRLAFEGHAPWEHDIFRINAASRIVIVNCVHPERRLGVLERDSRQVRARRHTFGFEFEGSHVSQVLDR